MASVSQLTQGNLLPFRIYNDGDVIPFLSLDGTGQNGQFVTIETGVLPTSGTSTQNPENSFGGYQPNAVGAAYTNVISYRYANNRKVRPCVSGDNVYNVVGVTLHTTANVDENLNPLVNLPYDRVTERGYVLSGFSTPILTAGIVTIKSNQYNGIPIPGYVGCVTTGGGNGPGSIDVVNPANLSNTISAPYSHFTVLGKFLSTSGVNFGGYAQFKVLT
jgi:hypothetical protein